MTVRTSPQFPIRCSEGGACRTLGAGGKYGPLSRSAQGFGHPLHVPGGDARDLSSAGRNAPLECTSLVNILWSRKPVGHAHGTGRRCTPLGWLAQPEGTQRGLENGFWVLSSPGAARACWPGGAPHCRDTTLTSPAGPRPSSHLPFPKNVVFVPTVISTVMNETLGEMAVEFLIC